MKYSTVCTCYNLLNQTPMNLFLGFSQFISRLFPGFISFSLTTGTALVHTVHVHLCAHVESISISELSKVKQLDRRIRAFKKIWEIITNLSDSSVKNMWESIFFCLPQLSMLSSFMISADLKDEKWYFAFILICIFKLWVRLSISLLLLLFIYLIYLLGRARS